VRAARPAEIGMSSRNLLSLPEKAAISAKAEE